MSIRSLASAVTALLVATAAMPASAQTEPQLALNAAEAAPDDGEGHWRLTLEFGRADRTPSATARSVQAPALAAHDIVIRDADGVAAPFVVREVGSPSGNKLTLVIEHFGPTALAASDRFTVSILEDDTVAPDRSSAEFDFLPPALDPAG